MKSRFKSLKQLPIALCDGSVIWGTDVQFSDPFKGFKPLKGWTP